MEEHIKIPRDIMIGLCRIMAGTSANFNGYEVYPEAISGMKAAHKWVSEWCKTNKIDIHGKNG